MVGEALDETDLQGVDVSVYNALNSLLPSFSACEDDQVADLLMQALTSCSAAAVLVSDHKFYLSQSVARRIVTNALVHSEADGVDRTSERETRVAAVIHLIFHLHLVSQASALSLVIKGLSTILPTDLLPMFTVAELEAVICGESEMDVNTLKQATVYESVNPSESHIGFFWQALDRMDSAERSSFVNFCSGRSRLPAAASDFPMSFKLTAPPPHSETAPDDYLPIARTCFFQLSLPKYSSTEVCLEKLRYAISHTELMDADFIDRRGTSGWENVR